MTAIKRRKSNYCHQAYSQILVTTLDFMKILKQTEKSRNRVLDIQISSLSQLQNSSVALRSATYLQVQYLNGYIPGQQYDVHKCLIQLLQKFYHEVNDDRIFKISLLESAMFEENCGHSTENTFSCAELGLQVQGSVITETTGLLEKSQNSVLLEGCQCSECGNVGTSRKADLVTHTSEIMIFHVELFQYSSE